MSVCSLRNDAVVYRSASEVIKRTCRDRPKNVNAEPPYLEKTELLVTANIYTHSPHGFNIKAGVLSGAIISTSSSFSVPAAHVFVVATAKQASICRIRAFSRTRM
jgi:hypothetical protein